MVFQAAALSLGGDWAITRVVMAIAIKQTIAHMRVCRLILTPRKISISAEMKCGRPLDHRRRRRDGGAVRRLPERLPNPHQPLRVRHGAAQPTTPRIFRALSSM